MTGSAAAGSAPVGLVAEGASGLGREIDIRGRLTRAHGVASFTGRLRVFRVSESPFEHPTMIGRATNRHYLLFTGGERFRASPE